MATKTNTPLPVKVEAGTRYSCVAAASVKLCLCVIIPIENIQIKNL